MDFEFSAEELRFRDEVERFLDEHHSDQVMDANPEQLSQTVDTQPKRAFIRALAERGWLGMSWRGAAHAGKGVGIVGKTKIQKNIIARRGLGLPKNF